MDELREFTLLLEDSDSDMTLLAPEVPVTSEIPALVGVNRVEPWLLGEAGILAVAPGDESSQMDLCYNGPSDLPPFFVICVIMQRFAPSSEHLRTSAEPALIGY